MEELHGYFDIDGELFLVKRNDSPRFQLLPFILQGIRGGDVAESIMHLPFVILDRREREKKECMSLPAQAFPVFVYHESIFRKRELLYIKGMKDVYGIRTYQDEDGIREVEEGSFPLANYTGIRGKLPRWGEGEQGSSFLNIMKERYLFRTELSSLFTQNLRKGKGKTPLRFTMRCSPMEAAQVFEVAELASNDRVSLGTRSLLVVEKPKVPRRLVATDLLIVDIPHPPCLCGLLGEEYYRFILQHQHFTGEEGCAHQWSTSFFAVIDPEKFRITYDCLSNTLAVSAAIKRKNYEESDAISVWQKKEAEVKNIEEKYMGSRIYDVENKEWLWIVLVEYDMSNFMFKILSKSTSSTHTGIPFPCSQLPFSPFIALGVKGEKSITISLLS